MFKVSVTVDCYQYYTYNFMVNAIKYLPTNVTYGMTYNLNDSTKVVYSVDLGKVSIE